MGDPCNAGCVCNDPLRCNEAEICSTQPPPPPPVCTPEVQALVRDLLKWREDCASVDFKTCGAKDLEKFLIEPSQFMRVVTQLPGHRQFMFPPYNNNGDAGLDAAGLARFTAELQNDLEIIRAEYIVIIGRASPDRGGQNSNLKTGQERVITVDKALRDTAASTDERDKIASKVIYLSLGADQPLTLQSQLGDFETARKIWYAPGAAGKYSRAMELMRKQQPVKKRDRIDAENDLNRSVHVFFIPPGCGG